MNPLRDMIINEIVRPEINRSLRTYIGTIESYDSSTNTADVRVGGPNSNEVYRRVPVSRSAGYVHGESPNMGTPVILSFLNGDMNYPYVVSLLENYPKSLSTGKKFMMPDHLSFSIPFLGTSTGYSSGHPAF